MKKSKLLFWLLIGLPFVLAAIFYPSLPEKVPMHYGPNMEVDRWGNKIEIFLFPVLTFVLGMGLQNVTARLAAKEQTGPNNQKLSQQVMMATLVLFNIIFMFILFTTINGMTDLNELPMPMGNVLGIILGAFLMFIGNLSPKAKLNKNSWLNIGFRTPWSKKNEDTWRQTQLVSGYASILAGLVLIISGFVVQTKWMPVVILVTLLAYAIGVSLYSYLVVRKY